MSFCQKDDQLCNGEPCSQCVTDGMRDDCPMHSRGWLQAVVRNNRQALGESPQDCTCGDAA